MYLSVRERSDILVLGWRNSRGLTFKLNIPWKMGCKKPVEWYCASREYQRSADDLIIQYEIYKGVIYDRE